MYIITKHDHCIDEIIILGMRKDTSNLSYCKCMEYIMDDILKNEFREKDDSPECKEVTKDTIIINNKFMITVERESPFIGVFELAEYEIHEYIDDDS
jgi:hypothetical protein